MSDQPEKPSFKTYAYATGEVALLVMGGEKLMRVTCKDLVDWYVVTAAGCKRIPKTESMPLEMLYRSEA